MSRFPDGARVCFIGDSITQNNLHIAHILAYYREHFPDSHVEFYNCGISAGQIGTILDAFDEDVLNYNPTHVVIMSGINDSRRGFLEGYGDQKYSLLKDAFEIYKANLSMLCEKLTMMGVDITLCTPTPYAEYIKSVNKPLHGGSALMLGYAEYVKTFAKENGYPVCDYHSYMTEALQTEDIFSPDFIHPTPRGQYHLAKCFLAFQGFDIGEEKPLPDDIKKWHEVVGQIRSVYATVHLIIGVAFSLKGFKMSKEERRIKIKEYLDSERTGKYVELFKKLASKYNDSEEKLEENIQFAIDFMKNKKMTE